MSRIKYAAIILICVFILMFVATNISIAVQELDSSWEKGGSPWVTVHDLWMRAQDNSWWNDTTLSATGKKVRMRSGEDKNAVGGMDLVDLSGALCFGHGWDNQSAEGLLFISHIIDVDVDLNGKPGTVTLYRHDGNVFRAEATSNLGAQSAVKMAYWAYQARNQSGKNSYLNSPKNTIGAVLNNEFSNLRDYLGLDGFSNLTNENWLVPSPDGGEEYLNGQITKYQFEDKTKDVKNPLNPTINYSGDKSYIGPYKITTVGGDITSVTLSSGNQVQGYATSIGGAVSSISNIPSNTEFYIVVNEKVTQNTTVTIYKKCSSILKARIMILEPTASGTAGQFIGIFKADTTTKNQELQLPQATIPYGNFSLVKMDSKTQARLANVKFKFTKDGKYLRWSSSNNGTYTGMSFTTSTSDANTIFTTNSNGEILVNNAELGTYKFIEIENNNEGYVVGKTNPANNSSFTVSRYGTSAKDIAGDIIYSQEGINNKNKLNNTEFVKMAYRAILGREADTRRIKYLVSIIIKSKNNE